MELNFDCPHCAQGIVIDESGAGMQIECPSCQGQLIVPEAAPAPEPIVAPPPPMPALAGEQYICNNSACGATLYASQLLTTQLGGGKSIQVCPKCRLGVTKVVTERSFWSKLPAAFVYPFRGAGVFVIMLGTPILLANDFLGFGIVLIFVKLVLLGLIGTVLINIIHSTADNETTPLEWPDFGDRFEMVVVGLQMVGSALLVFAPAIVFLIMMVRAGDPGWGLAAIGCGLLGLVYYPMSFLAFAMFESLNGINPLIVMPAIVKLPLQYLAILALIGVMLLVRGGLAFLSVDLPLLWRLGCLLPLELVAFYSLLVSARLLALLYRSNAAELGWFE